MEIFLETIKLSCLPHRGASCTFKYTPVNEPSTNRAILGIGRARHRSSVRRSLSGRFFNFNSFRENADTKVEVIVKPIDDEEAIKLGADLVADILLMSLMFTYMFYSLYLRRKKYNDLCAKQTEQTQFIIARLNYLESELHKLQK